MLPPTGSPGNTPGASTATNAPAWQHIESGRIVSRTKAEIREEHGMRRDSLDSLVAWRLQISRGWRLVPRSLLGESSR